MPFLSKNATRSCGLTPARRKPCATCAERDRSWAQVKVRSPRTRETAFGCLRALSRTMLATSPTFKPGADFFADFFTIFFADFFATLFLAVFFLPDFLTLFFADLFATFFLAAFFLPDFFLPTFLVLFALFLFDFLPFDFLRDAICPR